MNKEYVWHVISSDKRLRFMYYDLKRLALTMILLREGNPEYYPHGMRIEIGNHAKAFKLRLNKLTKGRPWI